MTIKYTASIQPHTFILLAWLMQIVCPITSGHGFGCSGRLFIFFLSQSAGYSWEPLYFLLRSVAHKKQRVMLTFGIRLIFGNLFPLINSRFI